MASIFSFLFGSKFPSTAKYEAQQQKLLSDYARFNDYANSTVYARFQELDEIIHTGEFEKRIQKLKNDKFKGSESYHKLIRYQEMKKSKDIKTYLHFVGSGKEKKLNDLLVSPRFIEFKELEMITQTPDFKNIQNQKGFKKTDEYQQLKTFKALKRSADVRFVNKTLGSPEYQLFTSVNGSARLHEYKELEKLVDSKEFKENKAYLEDRKRFQKSEEFKLLEEYQIIEKSEDYKWFKKTGDLNPFGELHKWQLTFEDDFDQKTIDSARWMNGYFWGKALLNDNYVLSHEKQFFTARNIETRDSAVHIVSKQDSVTGKVWDAEKGFSSAEFNYSSGLINTGQSFRQLYGRFDVKVRFKTAKAVSHACWLLSEKMTPQITLFKTSSRSSSFEAGTFTGSAPSKIESHIQRVKGVNFRSDYHVFSLEWAPNKLVWRINGVQVHEQNKGIPDVPMYLIFSSHLSEGISEKVLPVSFEIDWVRCYQLAK